MAIFFLMVGLEVKKAFLIGDLSSFSKASLPVIAAIGGFAIPALCYLAINYGKDTQHGWAIPMATDIAFALAVLNLAAGKLAGTAKTFLSTLAIADDICAIIVIAIFYSSGIHLNYLIAAAVVFALQLGLNRLGVKSIWIYLSTGAVLWYLLHHSGIHATIAGVLTALAVPLSASNYSPLEKLEHALLKPVNFLIVPIFVLSNTNITLNQSMLQGVVSPLALGIYVGLLLGKPAGILLTSFLTVKLKISSLPKDLSWKHLMGLGMLAGIGFTMSIFVALLSFDESLLQDQAKFAILLASTVAGVAGYLIYKHAAKTSDTVFVK